MTDFDVVGFGALNFDRLFKVDAIAAPGQESRILGQINSPGGSAANTIVDLAKLGCRTGFIGKVANDDEGRMLLKDFQKRKVDTDGIIIDKHGRSGQAIGFVDQTGQRALYIDPGVNDTIAFPEINQDYASETRFLHLASFAGEKGLQTQKKLLTIIRGNVRISLDPGIFYARLDSVSLAEIIKKTYVLMPNASELELLTGETDYCRGAELLLEKGVKVVAVKLGGSGCYVTDGTQTRVVKAYNVRVVDTTGAGDAFSAGFLYGLLKNKSLEKCGKIGNFLASRCITKMGARTGLPTLHDLAQNKLL
jgi:ribokinase